MSRAQRIKETFSANPCFKADNPSFECGDQIAYQMEKDYRAMQQAIQYLNSFIETNPENHWVNIAKQALEKRVKEF